MPWPIEKRREPRYNLKTPVWIEAVNGRRIVATVRDISDHGLGLWIAASEVGGGDAVRVRVQDEEIPALVRHSKRAGTLGESTIGVELQQGITDRQVDALLTLGFLA